MDGSDDITATLFLSTLSLRRATYFQFSPCPLLYEFLSTLSLRRATVYALSLFPSLKISIHALLAESDRLATRPRHNSMDFYPRSPCGERLNCLTKDCCSLNFYPRSPCGERLPMTERIVVGFEISIHALLAESDLHYVCKSSCYR